MQTGTQKRHDVWMIDARESQKTCPHSCRHMLPGHTSYHTPRSPTNIPHPMKGSPSVQQVEAACLLTKKDRLWGRLTVFPVQGCLSPVFQIITMEPEKYTFPLSNELSVRVSANGNQMPQHTHIRCNKGPLYKDGAGWGEPQEVVIGWGCIPSLKPEELRKAGPRHREDCGENAWQELGSWVSEGPSQTDHGDSTTYCSWFPARVPRGPLPTGSQRVREPIAAVPFSSLPEPRARWGNMENGSGGKWKPSSTDGMKKFDFL